MNKLFLALAVMSVSLAAADAPKKACDGAQCPKAGQVCDKKDCKDKKACGKQECKDCKDKKACEKTAKAAK